jgi:hypothetical protein
MGSIHGIYSLPLRKRDTNFHPPANGPWHLGKGTIFSAPRLLKRSRKILHHASVGEKRLA